MSSKEPLAISSWPATDSDNKTMVTTLVSFLSTMQYTRIFRSLKVRVLQQLCIRDGQQQIFFRKGPDMIGRLIAYQIHYFIIDHIKRLAGTDHIIPVLEFKTQLPEPFLIHFVKGQCRRRGGRREGPVMYRIPRVDGGRIVGRASIQ